MFLSIRRHVTVIIVAMTLLMVMAVAWIALTGSRGTIRGHITTSLIETNKALAARFDVRLQTAAATARTLAHTLIRPTDSPVDLLWYTSSQVMLESDALVRQVNVYSPIGDGFPIFVFAYPQAPSTMAALTRLPPEQVAPWVEDALSADALRWRGPDTLAVDGSAVVRVVVPFRDFEGLPRGVVWLDLSAAELATEMAAAFAADAATRPGYSVLVNADNLPVAAYGQDSLTTDEIHWLQAAVSGGRELAQADGTFHDWANPVIVSHYLDLTGWQLLTVLPPGVIAGPVETHIIQVVLVVLVGVGLVGWAVFRLLTRRLSEPLYQLTIAAQEIGFGEVRYVVPYQDRQDEIGRMARALQDMKNSISYSYRELARWSRTLEERVTERTRELEQARQEALSYATEMQAVYDASLSLVGDHQLPVLLQNLTERINRLLPADYCAVWLLTSDKQHVKLIASTDEAEGEIITAVGLGVAGVTITEASPLILEDYGDWPGRQPETDPDLAQVLAVPLMFYNKPIGVLIAGRRTLTNIFAANDQRLVALLANLMSPIVRNAQLYNRLGEAMQAASRANKVKTQFLASVTHELRTPLNLVINNMDFMRIGMFGEVNAEQIARLDQTTRSAEHLLYLINDLLDVSKIESGEMQLFIQVSDPYTLIEDALDSTMNMLEDKPQVTLEVNMPENLPHIPMDARRVRQVLTNLLSNAIKYTSEGDVRLDVRLEFDRLFFVVSDTGIGIAADEIDRLFQMFERTNRARELGIDGTGLGLAISRFLVEAHGGTLTVESEVGVGSTFTFGLPLKQNINEDGKRVTAVMRRPELG